MGCTRCRPDVRGKPDGVRSPGEHLCAAIIARMSGWQLFCARGGFGGRAGVVDLGYTQRCDADHLTRVRGADADQVASIAAKPLTMVEHRGRAREMIWHKSAEDVPHTRTIIRTHCPQPAG